jgi:hypothetical protein
MPFVRYVQEGNAERAVGFVHNADRGHARIGLGDSGAVDEPGLAAIAGARVDFGELDQL